MPTPPLRPALVLASAAGLWLTGTGLAADSNASAVAMPSTDNPLLTASTLPYHLPPFDRIKDTDYEPAFDQGMAEHLKEINAIADNPEPPTFDNTILALERAGRTLERVDLIFGNLSGANTNPKIQDFETAVAPKQAAHNDTIFLNGKLFARIQALSDQKDSLNLDPESKRLLERYEKDFVRAGAKLSDADKTKLKAMNSELASLETTFNQAVLKEKNADSIIVTDRAQLAGMTDGEVAATEVAAKADHQEGKFVIRLLNTTTQPALTNLTNRELRQRIMEASLSRNSHGGEFDDKATIARIARLRAERASSATRPTPPTSWTNRPSAAWKPSTSSSPTPPPPPLPTRRRKARTSRPSSTRRAGASRWPRTIGTSIRRRCARRSTTSTNPNSGRTSS